MERRINSSRRNRLYLCLFVLNGLDHTLAGPQQIERERQAELFAHETRDETAAAHLAARFHAPQRNEQVAPRRSQRFPLTHHVTEYDTPALEELASNRIGVGLADAVAQERPAPRRVSRARTLMA